MKSISINDEDSDPANRLIARSIWVCGCGRSGTSIFSSLIASHKNFEFSFDPPIVHWLLGLANRLDEDVFFQLLKIYIYRESFRGALAARTLNFNLTDQSAASKFKSPEELAFRQTRPLDAWLNEDLEISFRLCLKVTDATFRLQRLLDALRGLAFIAIIRNPFDVVRSVHEKRWFARNRAGSSITSETLPFRFHLNAGPVPLWLEEDDTDLWLEASDWERAALYCIRASDEVLRLRDRISLVNYDWFVRNPKSTAEQLQFTYNMQSTDATHEILQAISPHHYSSREKLNPKVLSNSTKKKLQELESTINMVSLRLMNP